MDYKLYESLNWIGPGVRVVDEECGVGTVIAVYRTTAAVHFDTITPYGVHTLEPRLVDLKKAEANQ